MVTDLLFYQPGAVAEFYQTDHATIEVLASHNNWRANWTHIVSGNFGGDSLTDLLFYDATAGEGEFYSVDGIGGLKLLRVHSGWRNSWTHIIPGKFGRDGRTDLLFYDASDGTGEFYATRGPGDIVRIGLHDWSTGWTQIVPGSFGGNGFTDLLFYNAGLGEGAFYAVDQGQAHLIEKSTGWRNTWSLIVPGNFGDSGSTTDLLLYDADGGLGDFYATDQGRLREIRKHTGWRQGWKNIVPGDFGGTAADDLLFYEPATGTGEFYEVDNGNMTMLRTSDDWQHTWTHIVPGLYAPPRAVRIHVKVIYAPDGTLNNGNKDSVEVQIADARATLVRAGLRMIVGSNQSLDRANGYAGSGPDIDKGECSGGFFGDNVSGDMWELFTKYDDDVGPNELAIYFARSLYQPYGDSVGGCARHPNGKPGAVMSSMHKKYTLPHEIGHVLGLDHTDDPDRCMYDEGEPRTRPPTFDSGEIDTMTDSPYTIDI